MKDPIVIDPPGMDVAAAWKECHAYSDRMHAAGRPIAAAAGADPGICSCPACREMHWQWGKRQRCTKCGYEYPTDAWPRYSEGVHAAIRPQFRSRDHERLMEHPYYRYGFEHPVEATGLDAYDAFQAIDWKAVFPMEEKP
jgi:hypothetical protein